MKNELLEKYLKGEASTSENELIGKWLKENPNCVKELSNMRRLHETMLWKQPTHTSYNSLSKSNSQSIYRHPLLKIAAIIIVILTFGNIILLNGQWEKSENQMQTLYVPAGQRANITLSDGTKVWVNALSTLIFPSEFNDDNREVKLIGEGFFDVTPDTHHPFIVHTPKYNIKVLGTKFNVSSYPQTNYFETSLIEGSVEILDSTNNAQAILQPGTKVTAYNNGKLEKSRIDNYDYYLWKDGLICFDEITIEELFNKLEVYYDIQIIVQKKSIINKTFTGKLRICDGINHALDVIQVHTPFIYSRDDDRNIITIR